MPMMRWRVVCGFRDVMLIFCPTRWLSSVDLPTFGRPTIATRPVRCTASLMRDRARIRRPCGFLLGAAAAQALALRADVELGYFARHLKNLLVRLAVHGDHRIARQRQLAALQMLLEQRFGVSA